MWLKKLLPLPVLEVSHFLGSIAARLLDLSSEDLPLDEPIRAASRYKDITRAEVQAAFARWIRPDDLVQVTIGPKPE